MALIAIASQTLTAGVTTEVWRVDQSRSNITIVFTDRSGSDQNIRLWISPIDTPRSDDHAWIYDRKLPANSTLLFPLTKITLELGTIIYAYASVGSVSFNVAD